MDFIEENSLIFDIFAKTKIKNYSYIFGILFVFDKIFILNKVDKNIY